MRPAAEAGKSEGRGSRFRAGSTVGRMIRSGMTLPAVLAATGLLTFVDPASAPAGDWPQALTPTAAAPQAIGSPARGCLDGGQRLSLDGPGWQVMRPSRNRFWGHTDLIGFIERLAGEAARQDSGLLVGDLSMPRGGPMPNGHRSHQFGLDVDIWFEPAPAAPLSPSERESLPAVSVLAADGEHLDPVVWTNWHETMLHAAAVDPAVDRIFVNPAIKRALCTSTPAADRAWLHRIRPWWGHDDHFHVRLVCPALDDSCIPTEPIPPGDGCDASLDWWFSAEARAPKPPGPPPKPLSLDDLPPACRAILTAEDPPRADAALR
ncbi:MAG: penicillin-insensitive murein endopeptidase [Rhodospirillales bacterium]|nr:penicillin-insensitive murein endopeptidase [Rhodospirillales bacterium]